jgi:tetratricopeptide (TPR) repeat protein
MLIYNKLNIKMPMLALVFISVFTGINPVFSFSASSIKGTSLGRNKTAEKDTSEVYSYTRSALSLIIKTKKLELVKEKIDSAELICENEKIEFPALLHLARAEYLFVAGDFRNALMDASQALKKAKNFGETKVVALTLNFLGRYNLHTGFFKESIEYFNNSISLAKKNKIKGIVPRNLFYLKDVYDTLALSDQKQYRLTLKLLIDEAKNENDTFFLLRGLYFHGTSLTNKERDFIGADTLLHKCLQVSLTKNDTSFICLSLANLGWNFYQEKKYDSAIKYYNKSLSYSIPGKRYGYSSNALGNLGTVYRDLGETEKSIQYYSKSIAQAKQLHDIYNLSWVYKDMSQLYLLRKDTSNAYKCFVLFKEYNDELIKFSNSQGLTAARIKFDADTHNKELELLSLRLRNQKLLIYGYTGLFVLSIAIGILLLSRSKINSKRRISEMNRKISEVTQANLRQQMNPHFIFNTLNSIQYYMYQHDKLATNNYLTKFSSLMRKVLDNSQHTSVPLRDELDALNLYLELEMIRFKEKFNYEINIDDEIDTIMYKVPTMLIQPYVENSICHGLMPGEGKGLIKIDLKLEKDYISCTIEDNGIGREASQERKRNIDSKHNSLRNQFENNLH